MLVELHISLHCCYSSGDRAIQRILSLDPKKKKGKKKRKLLYNIDSLFFTWRRYNGGEC
jgi:hypothetical protein